MRTLYRTAPEYAEAFLKIIDETDTCGTLRPTGFIKAMQENIGYAAPVGLDRKNPVIVAFGDSVTAGHFEPRGNLEEIFDALKNGRRPDLSQGEVFDPRECFCEKFRSLLIDHFERTAVSTINSGIAADTVNGMELRVYRDVIRYQPDLVIINAALNWGANCGDSKAYEAVLSRIIEAIQTNTSSEIILMTPNMQQLPAMLKNPMSPLIERVEIIRRLAEEKQCCLADAYLAWEKYASAGYPVEALLSDHVHHPSVTGHEGFAKILMKLIVT